MKKIVFLFISLIMLCACGQKADKKAVKETPAPVFTGSEKELQAIDEAFSKVCFDNGLIEAFNEYATEDIILMREGDRPAIGMDSINAIMSKGKSVRSLTTRAERIKIASGKDMGYVFGPWKISTKGKNGQDKSKDGYFTSIWHKEADGKWKLELFCMTSNTLKEKPQKDMKQKDTQQQNDPQNKYY